jgi:hypothetical protein
MDAVVARADGVRQSMPELAVDVTLDSEASVARADAHVRHAVVARSAGSSRHGLGG